MSEPRKEPLWAPTKTDKNPAELLELFEKYGAGLNDGSLSQTRARLSMIHVAPNVFQPRGTPEELGWREEEHIETLARVVRAGHSLEPITLWPVGGTRYVVDGHCRLEAYRRAGREASDWVPVRHLRDTSFPEAVILSLDANSRDKLSLTEVNKTEGAWRLLRINQAGSYWTQREIARSAGVSRTTIQTMVKALRVLLEKGEDPNEWTWAEVRNDRKQEPSEKWRENQMRAAQKVLRNTWGRWPDNRPEDAAEAYDGAYPRSARVLKDEGRYEVEGDRDF
jgi:hypothetical protein